MFFFFFGSFRANFGPHKITECLDLFYYQSWSILCLGAFLICSDQFLFPLTFSWEFLKLAMASYKDFLSTIVSILIFIVYICSSYKSLIPCLLTSCNHFKLVLSLRAKISKICLVGPAYAGEEHCLVAAI